MAPVLIAVALGVLAGHLNLLPYNQKITGRFTTLCLFVMLLAMGAQLGANEKLLADLGKLGWQALVLAIGSIAGSVLLVRLAESHIANQLQKSRNKSS